MSQDSAHALLPPDLHMLERGWLSSNSLLMLGDPRGAVIVDTGYCTHKVQTSALVSAVFGSDQRLRLIANTHLHSDHCGGNAHLASQFDCPIWVPPGHFEAALAWDETVLSYTATGQKCDRFAATAALRVGGTLEQAGRHWEILAAPGHDTHSVILFERESGILMSADALWEHGFGIVFPEIDGAGAGFDEVEATLDVIANLPVRLVVPGHGRLFSEATQAVFEARERLAFFRRNPVRHARHAAKALIKFHLLEVVAQPLSELLDWLLMTPIHRQIWQQYFSATNIADWNIELLEELQKSGVLHMRGDMIHNS